MNRKKLAALTVKELKIKARAAGIVGYSKMKKSQLVAALTTKEVPARKQQADKLVSSKLKQPAKAKTKPVKTAKSQVKSKPKKPVSPPVEPFDMHYDLPTTYLKPRARLMVQSPERICLQWDFDPETAARLTTGPSPAFLRLLQNGQEVLRTPVDIGGRRYYLQAPQGGGLIHAELGLVSYDSFVPLIRSNDVEIPVAAVSTNTAVTFVAAPWVKADQIAVANAHFLSDEQYQAFFGDVRTDQPWYRDQTR
jgi:hypothetical protein